MEELTDIDSIVEATETSNTNEIPMTSDELPQEQAQMPQVHEFEFTAHGKPIKVPLDDPRIKTWLSQGYEAPNRFGEYNRKIQEYEKTIQNNLQSLKGFEQYKKIDEWAKNNPQDWQQLTQNWQQTLAEKHPLPPEVQQRLEKVEQVLNQNQQIETDRRNRLEDQALDQEIGSIRKQYPNLDFEARDKEGKSLEYRILEYATSRGIPNFKTAFRDYCFDQLVQMSEHKGRENVSKSFSKTKAGLLGKDPNPARTSTPDLRGKNYDQIHEEVLRALGL